MSLDRAKTILTHAECQSEATLFGSLAQSLANVPVSANYSDCESPIEVLYETRKLVHELEHRADTAVAYNMAVTAVAQLEGRFRALLAV